MVSENTRRRFLAGSGIAIVGLSGCLGDDDDGSEPDEESAGNGTTDTETSSSTETDSDSNSDADAQSNPDRSLDWDGQGSENAEQDCEPDEVGFWKWILTPGGQPEIVVDDDEPVLTVTFEDGTEETVTGFRPGEGGGAVQFEVFKDGGGTVESASVEFSGGGGNPVLTISEGACLEDEDEEPPDEKKPDVVTERPRKLSKKTAHLNGRLVDLGKYDHVYVYFEYRKVGADEWKQTQRQLFKEPGHFSDVIRIKHGAEYEYKAAVKFNDKTRFGDRVPFTIDDRDKKKDDHDKNDKYDEKKDKHDNKKDK